MDIKLFKIVCLFFSIDFFTENSSLSGLLIKLQSWYIIIFKLNFKWYSIKVAQLFHPIKIFGHLRNMGSKICLCNPQQIDEVKYMRDKNGGISDVLFFSVGLDDQDGPAGS